ncbi:hypothetical protein EYF80_057940 [Liparis tanakae]|uniref:Uncharacterized protein n=1 Tax=Liparis tanakae TaxID=230148 RepID=A0A4Z2EUF5_9TELE|nr:hypothetical protein EYF80_057940 [Liparis tanakae]
MEPHGEVWTCGDSAARRCDGGPTRLLIAPLPVTRRPGGVGGQEAPFHGGTVISLTGTKRHTCRFNLDPGTLGGDVSGWELGEQTR